MFFTKNGRAVRRFAANNPKHMEELKKYINYNKMNEKYEIFELRAKRDSPSGYETLSFDPYDYASSSTILVNEKNIAPSDVFFRYVWALLLKHPL